MTGTHFNYYHVCHRKLWLFANDINMEHTSDLVFEGKLLHEESYPQRPERYEVILTCFEKPVRIRKEAKKELYLCN